MFHVMLFSLLAVSCTVLYRVSTHWGLSLALDIWSSRLNYSDLDRSCAPSRASLDHFSITPLTQGLSFIVLFSLRTIHVRTVARVTRE